MSSSTAGPHHAGLQQHPILPVTSADRGDVGSGPLRLALVRHGQTPEAHRSLHALYRAWHSGDLEAARTGGESGKQVLDRYLADVAAIRSAHRHGTAVLVSHGAAIRLAVVALA